MRADPVLLPAPPPTHPSAHLFFGPTVKYAGWWARVGAYIVDALLVGFSANLIGAFGVGGTTGAVIILLLTTVGSVAYYLILTANGRRTIGRKILGIAVVRDGGGDLTYGQAGLRLLTSVVSWLTFFLGVLWPLWDDKRQTFHDKIALTVVIKV